MIQRAFQNQCTEYKLTPIKKEQGLIILVSYINLVLWGNRQRLSRNWTEQSLTWLTSIHRYTGNPLKWAIFHFTQVSTFFAAQMSIFSPPICPLNPLKCPSQIYLYIVIVYFLLCHQSLNYCPGNSFGY